jgi:hypothetical protein
VTAYVKAEVSGQQGQEFGRENQAILHTNTTEQLNQTLFESTDRPESSNQCRHENIERASYRQFLKQRQDGFLVGVGAAASRCGGEGLGGVGGDGEHGKRRPTPPEMAAWAGRGGAG